MTPISFPQQTTIFAKDQPEYRPLPAYSDGHTAISCWSLTWRERLLVLWFGRLWLSQMHFGQPLQPQLPSIESPFVEQSADAS